LAACEATRNAFALPATSSIKFPEEKICSQEGKFGFFLIVIMNTTYPRKQAIARKKSTFFKDSHKSLAIKGLRRAARRNSLSISGLRLL